VVDHPFGRQKVRPNKDGFIPARAQVMFGLLADGMRGVELKSNRGRASKAIVANHAFLAITARPPLGVLTRELTVISKDGDRLAVPFAPAVYVGDEPTVTPGTAPPGPQEVERQVEGGTIGWLLRREPRGQSLKEAGLAGRRLFHSGVGWQLRFARVVKPDHPSGLARVAVGLLHFEAPAGTPFVSHDAICTTAVMPVGGGGMCPGPVDRLFLFGPFSYGMAYGGGAQYVSLDGLASDDVARMEMFLASGERMALPLKDNVFRAEVQRLKFPIRLVAYDSDDRVIGIRAEDRLTG
jgi:hypothetical protein